MCILLILVLLEIIVLAEYTDNLGLCHLIIKGQLNLALERPATQSSTYNGALAARAVDGNRDDSSSSVASTNQENQSWWEIDLEHPSNITSTFLYERAKSRLCNFHVQYFDYEHELVRSVRVVNRAAEDTYDFVLARYLRVQLMANVSLFLAEVEVYGIHLPGEILFKRCFLAFLSYSILLSPLFTCRTSPFTFQIAWVL